MTRLNRNISVFRSGWLQSIGMRSVPVARVATVFWLVRAVRGAVRSVCRFAAKDPLKRATTNNVRVAALRPAA